MSRVETLRGQARILCALAVSFDAAAIKERLIQIVVEDNELMLTSVTEMLEEHGYRVLTARDAATALRVLETEPTIHLLFTDVGLPGEMNGRQLADEMRRRKRDLQVLFTTGYTRNAIIHQGRLDPGVELIVKPFTYAALISKIRRVLAKQVEDL